ncbi:MAG: HNH endonuclease [Chitinophagaceae bacterium]|nr:HNH endonuclease [Chitinophagaceae bacterium]MCW5914938.1 hypothetical protein [Chitinophagaceae bacterium]
MKKCIWCRQDENKTTFNKTAHIVPQALGGEQICENVCDKCNEFFGSHFQKFPSVETIIKEAFNISRIRFLIHFGEIGKNKILTKPTSHFFDIDIKKRKFELKLAYKLQKGYQEKLCRLLKKGIYKMFLEETERRNNNALDNQYDFIREFARYDLGDYPVFYYERTSAVILTPVELVKRPQFIIGGVGLKYLVNEPCFMEFEFLGHVFSIATTRYWAIAFDNYLAKSEKAKSGFFRGFIPLNRFNDFDFALKILDN